MKSVRTLLFGLVLCLTMLGANAIAQDPYPTGCDSYQMETDYCSDSETGCNGSLPNVITNYIGDGTDSITTATLTCSLPGGTCTGKSCPTCTSYPNEPVAQSNPSCTEVAGVVAEAMEADAMMEFASVTALRSPLKMRIQIRRVQLIRGIQTVSEV
jgi:hypothetical protein